MAKRLYKTIFGIHEERRRASLPVLWDRHDDKGQTTNTLFRPYTERRTSEEVAEATCVLLGSRKRSL